MQPTKSTKSAEPRSAGTLFKTREKLSWPPNRDFRILSIDGGGIRGILPLAILTRLEHAYTGGASVGNYFDLVTGTSTGGIIALGLGAGLTATDILHLYIERGGEVFPDYNWLVKKLLSFSQFIFNRCNEKALYKLIDEVVGEQQLWQSKVRLCIPAAETRHFEPFIFKTPHHSDYKKDWAEKMAHIAQTTSAAPSFFRPITVRNGYEFVDGGIWANNPIMIAIADVLACYDVPRDRIKVLSLGCVKSKFEMSWARRSLGGFLFWHSLMFESMHIQSQNVIGQARLVVGGDRVFRVDADPIYPTLELSDWASCKAILPTVAKSLVDALDKRIAPTFFNEPAIAYTPFYGPPLL